MIVFKGDFKEYIMLQVKLFKKLGLIHGFVKFGDKDLLYTRNGLFTVNIDELEKLFAEYGTPTLPEQLLMLK